jgi:hypothetical protein
MEIIGNCPLGTFEMRCFRKSQQVSVRIAGKGRIPFPDAKANIERIAKQKTEEMKVMHMNLDDCVSNYTPNDTVYYYLDDYYGESFGAQETTRSAYSWLNDWLFPSAAEMETYQPRIQQWHPNLAWKMPHQHPFEFISTSSSTSIQQFETTTRSSLPPYRRVERAVGSVKIPWKGDWGCTACPANDNHRRNKHCYNCGLVRKMMARGTIISNTVDDWTCPNENCRDSVFKKWNRCRTCKTPRPAQNVPQATGEEREDRDACQHEDEANGDRTEELQSC